MPILKSYTLGTKSAIAALKFGTGDIHVNTCIEPKNAVYFAQHSPKPVEEWRIGLDFDYEPEPDPHGLESYEGNVVWMEFDRVESIDAIIETLQECKRRMLETVEP